MSQPAAETKADDAFLQSDAEVLVAVDDGFAQTKLYHGRKTMVLPTAVASGVHVRSTTDGRLDEAIGIYKTNLVSYTCGEGVEHNEPNYETYHTSNLNRVAVHHALHRAGLAGRRVRLVCGLPVSLFFQDGQPNKELIAAKRKSLMVPVDRQKVPEDKKVITVASVTVLPQAIAAIGELLFDAQGRPKEAPGTFVVVDIGGQTTDIAIIESGRMIDHDRSASIPLGVLEAKRLFLDRIRARFGTSERFSWRWVEDAFRSRRVRILGEDHDLSAEAAEATAQIEEQIRDFIVSTLGQNTLKYERIVFVGGGAAYFTGLQGMYRQGVVVPNPETANVRGMHTFGLAQSARAKG